MLTRQNHWVWSLWCPISQSLHLTRPQIHQHDQRFMALLMAVYVFDYIRMTGIQQMFMTQVMQLNVTA